MKVKLPWILSKANVDESTIQLFKKLVNDLMHFMKKNMTTLFFDEYEPASEDYIASFA
jgi:hypothetical protein